MTDCELLELAAKAAGVELFYRCTGEIAFSERKGLAVADSSGWWNPLTDDGDALRLAVKIGLAVVPYPADIAALHNASGRSWAELRGDDTYAATRRAIVRAAAEIGSKT